MRQKVSEPTNGSFMILNARPENGSSSSALRSMFRVRSSVATASMPLMAGRRAGRQEVDNSVSSGCTPLFLKAEPQRTGKKDSDSAGALADQLAQRFIVRLVAFEVGFHRIVVLLDGGLDELLAPYSSALSFRLRGCRRTSHVAPRSSPFQTHSFISSGRHAFELVSAPIGSWTEPALRPVRSLIISRS
jgi:hypothetical protein